MSLQFSSSLDETKMVAMSSSLDGCYEKKYNASWISFYEI
jgi:hypothetical protein